MWVITLSIMALAALLAALCYVASGTRKLDARLLALTQEQSERRRRVEGELEGLQSYLTAHFQQPVARHAEVDRGQLAVAAHEREQALAP
jgi:hypothetical protein